AEVYFWLADYYLKARDGAGILEVLTKFRTRSEADVRGAEVEYYLGEGYRLAQNYRESLIHYESSLAQGEAFRPQCLLGKGLTYVGLGDFGSAIRTFEAAIEAARETPDVNLQARFELANAYSRQENFLEAGKAYLSTAILYEDKDIVPQALLRAGESFEKANRLEDARKAYKELIERFEDHPLAEQARQKLKGITP
ncbi:MAG: tetratricopeptide repeat protein, partial [Candidatus Omnitrophica bacterium]|nr:tetratricopeptide repeat protein [Candidatus Omnitrophota bacterium]